MVPIFNNLQLRLIVALFHIFQERVVPDHCDCYMEQAGSVHMCAIICTVQLPATVRLSVVFATNSSSDPSPRVSVIEGGTFSDQSTGISGKLDSQDPRKNKSRAANHRIIVVPQLASVQHNLSLVVTRRILQLSNSTSLRNLNLSLTCLVCLTLGSALRKRIFDSSCNSRTAAVASTRAAPSWELNNLDARAPASAQTSTMQRVRFQRLFLCFAVANNFRKFKLHISHCLSGRM